MTLLTQSEYALRCAIVLLFGGLAVWMIPAAWTASLDQKVRRGDPMRLCTFLLALNFVGYNLNTLLNGRDQGVLVGLLVLTLITGVQTCRLAKAYGRGPEL